MNSRNLPMNIVSKQLLLIVLVLQSAFIFAQDITLSGAAGGVSASPLAGGSTNKAIFGVQLDKAGGGTNSITGLTVKLTQDPTGRFLSARLVLSTDNTYDAGDLANILGTGTFSNSPNSINFSGTLTNFASATAATTQFLFLVVDIDPAVSSGTVAVVPSITNADISVANNAVLAATVTGISFSFIDTSTPTITFNPLAGAVNVVVSSNLIISFDEAIRNINDSDIDNANVGSLITLKLTNSGGADIPFTATINAGDDQITIDPTSNLNSDQVYYLNITSIEDGSNNATTATNITFTTTDTQSPLPTFNPLNGATNVVETNDIVINFNEAILRASDDANLDNTSIDGRITLKLGSAAGADIPFNASINAGDDQVTINPSSALPGNSVIYVAIAGVEDTNFNVISPDPNSITFTTGDTQAPTLTFNPANSATNVPVSSNLTITFNEAIRNIDNSAVSAANLLTLVDFKLTNSGGADVPFTSSIDGTNTIVTIDPTSNLVGNQVYFLRMNPVEDGVDNATTTQSITFISEAPPSFTGSPFSPSTTCVGDNIVISGDNFGAAVPTVTINGTSTTAAEIIANTNTSITFKTLSGMVGNNMTVTVLNNSNGLSSTSVSTVTIKSAIALSLPLSINPASPAINENYNIEVANTQNGINYDIRELPAGFGGTTPGTGGTISFGAYNKSSDGIYQYEIRATSIGCTQQIYGLLNVNIVALTVNAGADKTICAGDSVILGGNPTATGGTAFYNFTWNTIPPTSNFSTASNPLVKPTSTTTYRVSLKDSPTGTPLIDNITITVNPVSTLAFVDTLRTAFSTNDTLYLLSDKVIITPSGGTGEFSGQGIVRIPNTLSGKYYFNPKSFSLPTSGIPIIYSHTSSNGCVTTIQTSFSIYDTNVLLTGIDNLVCSNEKVINGIFVNPSFYTPPSGKKIGDIKVYHPAYGYNLPIALNYPLELVSVHPTNGPTYKYNPQKALAYLNYGGYQYTYLYLDVFLADASTGIVDPFYSTYQYVQVFAPGPKPEVLPFAEGQPVCETGSVINLNSSLESAGYSTLDFDDDSGISALIIKVGINYEFDPSKITFPGVTTTRNVQIVNFYKDRTGCLDTTYRNVVMVKQIGPPTGVDADYCQNTPDRNLTLEAKINNSSTDVNWYSDGGLTTFVGKGETFLTGLSGLSPQTKTFYATQLFNTCESTATGVIIEIKGAPEAGFTPPSICLNRPFTLVGPTDSDPDNIDIATWEWSFGDRDSLAAGQTVDYEYNFVNEYTIELTVTSTENCVSTESRNIIVGLNPKPSFDFSQICNGDNTSLVGNTDIPVQKYEWDFGDGIIIGPGNFATAAPEGGTFKSPLHVFTNGVGAYNVKLKAITSTGCYDTLTRELNILPVLTYTSSAPYFMANEDSGKGFWIGEDIQGDSVTWEFSNKNIAPLDFSESAWVTNKDGNYFPETIAALNSPCLNISGIDRPVLSFDFLSNINEGDGATFQYSNNGGTTWTNVGTIGSGKNWFNDFGITFGGGNNQGWSGNLWSFDTTWLEARRVLDDVAPRNKIRFRMFFISGKEGETAGFAFKNMAIESRNRKMLVENFTNSAAPNVIANNNSFYSLSTIELVKLEYHTSFPSQDELNSVDQNARSAYYGLTNSANIIPRVYVDGESEGDLSPPSLWFQTKSIFRALESSPLEIGITTLPADSNKFSIQASVKVNRFIPGKPIVHIVVVEKSLGVNQDVVRKFLPNAAGTQLPQSVLSLADSTFILNQVWQVNTINDLNEMAVVVFVQDENSKEVYQAEYLESPLNLPSVITGAEPSLAGQIIIYPNPAQGVVNIRLPNQSIKATPLTFIDGFGRIIYSDDFKIGEQEKSINTTQFAAGVYIILIETPSGEVTRKKVVIRN